MEVLRQLGGWELAAIAGAVIEARQQSIPVLLDGFVVTSAVMPLDVAHPGFLDHCWPAHVSAEPGHRRLVEKLGREPILDLEMRLGEASGALAALPILDLAARSVLEVATFEEWGLT
jgi:nicotinate-nucleotide--dimethylbenzimidazole phosphoribosyltransferase